MKDVYLESVSHYIDIVAEIGKAYPTAPLVDSPIAPKLIFRGLNDSRFELLPSIFRKTADNEQGIENDKYLAWASEKDILQAFRGEAMGYVKDVPATDYRTWAVYAQHYGVPTRFLDWSYSPLVALYFACKDKEHIEGAVWMLHCTNYQYFLHKTGAQNDAGLTIDETINCIFKGEKVIEYPILFRPYYIDNRMSAQSSIFMIWGSNMSCLDNLIPDELSMVYKSDNKRNNEFKLGEQNPIFMQIKIYPDQKKRFLRQLDMMGVNEKSLFPGLDGIGRYVESRYRFNYSEAIDCI